MFTDWIPVKNDVMINYDLESTPLQIKTDSNIGSNEFTTVALYTEQGADIGYVYFIFSSTPRYFISDYKGVTDFPTALPSEVNKIWQITKLPGPRIILHCNEVMVLDFTLSSECTMRTWKAKWNGKEVHKIMFRGGGTASDYYKPAPGNYFHNP